jgi:hypothetical protein
VMKFTRQFCRERETENPDHGGLEYSGTTNMIRLCQKLGKKHPGQISAYIVFLKNTDKMPILNKALLTAIENTKRLESYQNKPL